MPGAGLAGEVVAGGVAAGGVVTGKRVVGDADPLDDDAAVESPELLSMSCERSAWFFASVSNWPRSVCSRGASWCGGLSVKVWLAGAAAEGEGALSA